MAVPNVSVPTVQAAIVSAIEGQTGTDTSPILVCQGEPGQGPSMPADIIAVGTDIRFDGVPTVFRGDGGLDWINETYELDVLVSSWSGQDDPTDVINRAWTLVSYVSTAVRNDPSLGGIVNEAYPARIEGGRAVWAEDGGRVVEVTVAIHVSNLN